MVLPYLSLMINHQRLTSEEDVMRAKSAFMLATKKKSGTTTSAGTKRSPKPSKRKATPRKGGKTTAAGTKRSPKE
jgi:hypothetical protein